MKQIPQAAAELWLAAQGTGWQQEAMAVHFAQSHGMLQAGTAVGWVFLTFLISALNSLGRGRTGLHNFGEGLDL